MFKKPFVRSELSPIGLDIGAGEIRAVQLCRSGPDVSIACSAVFPRRCEPGVIGPISAEEALWLAETLARKGFVGRRVSVFAPHGACSVHVVDLPSRESGAPTEVIARAEIARTQRCSPDRFELATWYLPQRGRTERGLAVACEREDLDDHLDAIEGAGLTVVAVDLEDLALSRSCRSVTGQEQEAIHALLRIGWNATLGVLSLGDGVIYTRRFEFGVGAALGKIRDRAGISWNDAVRVIGSEQATGAFEDAARPLWSNLAEDLGAEIDTAITYVTHTHRTAPVGQVVVAGYGTGRPELIDTLDDILGMPVRAADCWDGADLSMASSMRARLAVAAGLARRFDP